MFFQKKKRIKELLKDNSKLSSTINYMMLFINTLNNKILQKKEIIQETENSLSKKNLLISELQNENKRLVEKIKDILSNTNMDRKEKQQDMPELFPLIHNQANNLETLIEFQINFLEYFGDNPFKKHPNLDDKTVKHIFNESIKLLEKSLSKLIGEINTDYSSRNISEESWNIILLMHSDLKKCLSNSFNVHTPVRLREISLDLFQIINASSCKLKNTRRKDLLSKTKELERLVCLYNLHRIIQKTQKNNNSLMSKIKSYINNDDTENSCDIFSVHSVLNEVIYEYNDLAKLRNIKIILPRDMNYELKLPKDCFKKSIGNLIENAIKYTGKLSPDSPFDKAWIDIQNRLISNKIIIDIESWGIPVTKEEYEGNFMFKEGYRGRFARHMGVTGTGIGLAYVYNFALKHKGEVKFKTVPVDKHSKTMSYTKTTVSLIFPVFKKI